MEPTDVTIEILKGIREEIRTGLDRVSERVEGVSDRLERVERAQVASELHLATELVAVVAAVDGVRDILREDRALRQQVNDHERRIQAIEERAG